jgi:hypothetical protein
MMLLLLYQQEKRELVSIHSLQNYTLPCLCPDKNDRVRIAFTLGGDKSLYPNKSMNNSRKITIVLTATVHKKYPRFI